MITRNRFVLNISETSATLFALEGGEVKDQWSLKDHASWPDALTRSPQSPVDICIQTPALQSMNEKLPSLTFLDMWRLARQKRKGFSQQHSWHGSRFFREEGHWWLQHIGGNEDIERWLRALPNPLGRLTNLDYESLFIVRKLRNLPHWQMLLTLHEGDTLRMTLFNGSRLELTRSLPCSVGATPPEIARSILESLESTVHYISRKTPEALQKLNIFAVVDEETRKFLKPTFLEAHQLHILTPYQLATRLGLRGKVPFRLSGPILLRALTQRWLPLIWLSSPPLKTSRFPLVINKKQLVIACGAVLAFLILDKGVQILTTSQSLTTLKSQKRMLQLEAMKETTP